jgi:hypothetical protein
MAMASAAIADAIRALVGTLFRALVRLGFMPVSCLL